jgi:hypothetical protein
MTDNRKSRPPKSLLCPSAEPEMEGSVIFGIVVGTPEQPELVHFPQTKKIPPELLTLESPVKPTEMFRIAAKCSEGSCDHFDGSKCRLVGRIVDGLPSVTENLPPCPIRANCRWWDQEGKAACQRCLQIVRDNFNISEELFNVLDPSIYPEYVASTEA